MAINKFVWNAYPEEGGNLVLIPESVGTTIRVYTQNTQIMSDVWGTAMWAEYWSESEQRIVSVHLDTWEYSRDATYGLAKGEVDANRAVLNKVKWFMLNQQIPLTKSKMQETLNTIAKGDSVVVTAGRKNKGAAGKIIAIIERPYRMGYNSRMEQMYGIATSDVLVEQIGKNGKVYMGNKDVVWAWARNCELETARVPSDQEVKEAAKRTAKGVYDQRYQEAESRCPGA